MRTDVISPAKEMGVASCGFNGSWIWRGPAAAARVDAVAKARRSTVLATITVH